jgi:hypothetical protein
MISIVISDKQQILFALSLPPLSNTKALELTTFLSLLLVGYTCVVTSVIVTLTELMLSSNSFLPKVRLSL